MIHPHVSEAQDILQQLGLPEAQQNERSALVLLALTNLGPDKTWDQVEAPLIGITPMMTFMADSYGKVYAPNSRETVRRESVHQFVSAGIAVQNPDDPARPTNSGKNAYQVPDALITLLRTYGTPAWTKALAAWKAAVPALRERWERAREMAMIPVTLPDGTEMALTPGGQNPLIRAVVEDFCPRFAPGGMVLYLGDAGEKFTVWDHERLTELGVTVDEHGKMPDVVVYDHDNNWLFLIEAVTTHGPINPKRHDELTELFGTSSVGLVFVTTFMTRKTFAEYLTRIAWETEVWIAEAPTHLIHFDGARFLGPYTRP